MKERQGYEESSLSSSVWNRALDHSKKRLMDEFIARGHKWFWREYDLQSYLYHVMIDDDTCKKAFVRDGACLVRREHHLIDKDNKPLLTLDIAVLDPSPSHAPHGEYNRTWPIRELIQLKYPREFKTGLTQPDDLPDDCFRNDPERYERRCRTRFKRKVEMDYGLFSKHLKNAINLSDSASCHMVYFDITQKRYLHTRGDIEKILGHPSRTNLEEVSGRKLDFRHVWLAEDGAEYRIL